MQDPDDTSDGSSGSQSLSAHHSILNGDEIVSLKINVNSVGDSSLLSLRPERVWVNADQNNYENTFEAKVKDKDSTAKEPKKISLLNNLNLSTSYNFAADFQNWSPVRVSTGLNIINLSLIHI